MVGVFLVSLLVSGLLALALVNRARALMLVQNMQVRRWLKDAD